MISNDLRNLLKQC